MNGVVDRIDDLLIVDTESGYLGFRKGIGGLEIWARTFDPEDCASIGSVPPGPAIEFADRLEGFKPKLMGAPIVPPELAAAGVRIAVAHAGANLSFSVYRGSEKDAFELTVARSNVAKFAAGIRRLATSP